MAAKPVLNIFSPSPPLSRLCPPHTLPTFTHAKNKPPILSDGAASKLRCKAVGSEQAAPGTKKQKSRYEMVNLTTWLLQQEQEGNVDAELAIVLSSISLACKQIASLLQRSNIINLTGAQGTVNVQGEDQKKLDVISNTVR